MNHCSLEYLQALQVQATTQGKKCVVSGLIRNEQGQIFVQRRAWHRKLFPGCWDVVGGHVESGEALVEALAREIHEETGWTLARTTALVSIFDWEAEGVERREFALLAEVSDNLAHPKLEREKIIELCWVGPEQVEMLKENRAADDSAISSLVQSALLLARSPDCIY